MWPFIEILLLHVNIYCISVVGDVASVMDGERPRPVQVHNAERRLEAEGREGLDEVRDGAQAAQTHPQHTRELP